jgi:hypothetical protein
MVGSIRVTVAAVAVLVFVAGCGGESAPSLGSQQPPVPLQSPTSSAHNAIQSQPKDTPTVDEQLKGYKVLDKGAISIPGIGESPVWFVQKKSPMIGVLVAVQGQLMTIHSPEPQQGMLVGPDITVPAIDVTDLDGDGSKEIMITGPAGMGTGVWVYQYDAKEQRFLFCGDIYGEKGVSRLPNPESTVTFQALQIDYNAKDQAVLATDWKWKPSGFYKVP